MELRQRALQTLLISDPATKAEAARALAADTHGEKTGLQARLDCKAHLAEPEGLPGRPARPPLVAVRAIKRRSAFTPAGRAALLHAVAHIEFNAINLALDAIWRFADMPQSYYSDWIKVAGEEAKHFVLLRAHLATLGHDYGDFDAHDGLWHMAAATKSDVLARMALVPRTLEARGLDATPPMQDRLRRAGDLRAVEILDIILHDEIGHVAIGNRWYRWLCHRHGLDPEAVYSQLAARYAAPRLRPPFNLSARRSAGFTQSELDGLGGERERQSLDPT